MALRILNSPSSDSAADVTGEMREAIERELPGARVEVRGVSPGHFEIDVVSETFADETRVRQQQRVYGAIAHLMKGDAAPVHAIDRLTTRLPAGD